MASLKKPFYSALVFFGTLVALSFVFAATTYYTDLPTASSGSTLTSANWNNLVNYANKAVKQETEVLTVTGGNVGIGTTSPVYGLHVKYNDGSIGWVSKFESSNPINNGAVLLGSRSAGKWAIQSITNGWLVADLSINPDGGNVGIGTPSPDQLFTVNGNARATTVLVGASAGGTYLNTTNQGGDPSSHDLTITAAWATNSVVLRSAQTIQMYTYYGGWYQERFRITNAGNATLAGTLTQNSDVRLKKEIAPIEGSLEKVSKLSGVTYYWKDSTRDSRRQIGVIAQEVEKVFPEAVITDEKGLKSVAYGNLVAPLIESVKELKQENDSLKKENQDIKSLLCLDHPTAEICR